MALILLLLLVMTSTLIDDVCEKSFESSISIREKDAANEIVLNKNVIASSIANMHEIILNGTNKAAILKRLKRYLPSMLKRKNKIQPPCNCSCIGMAGLSSYLVQIKDERSWKEDDNILCHGIQLDNPLHILTSATCCKHKEIKAVGYTKTNTLSEAAVQSCKLHPLYDIKRYGYPLYDVAIITLKSPLENNPQSLEFSSKSKWNADKLPCRKATFLHWEGPYSGNVISKPLTISTMAECPGLLKEELEASVNLFYCAKLLDENVVNTSVVGAPLLCQDDDSLIGLLSWADVYHKIMVFTKVDKRDDFLNKEFIKERKTTKGNPNTIVEKKSRQKKTVKQYNVVYFSINNDNQHYEIKVCEGLVLNNPEYILTAATCCQYEQDKMIASHKHHKTAKIKACVSHPNYIFDPLKKPLHDIALVTLETSLLDEKEMESYRVVIKNKTLTDEIDCAKTTFLVTDTPGKVYNRSVKLIPMQECQGILKDKITASVSSTYCGRLSDAKDIVEGRQGAPLLCEDTAELIGVVSWGDIDNRILVFQRTDIHSDFIKTGMYLENFGRSLNSQEDEHKEHVPKKLELPDCETVEANITTPSTGNGEKQIACFSKCTILLIYFTLRTNLFI